MAITLEPTQEERDNQAARIGAIFGLPNPGRQIVRDGVRLESVPGDGDQVLLRVELAEWVSRDEALAILTGQPLIPTASGARP
jgi:hypothetical protein